MSKQPDYLSYVLRLWRARKDGVTVWRAALLIVPGGSWLGFGTLDELFDYLRQETLAQGSSRRDCESPGDQ